MRRRMAAEADLYLGADSGVSHLAGALGLYTLAGFRHTDPEIWRPMGRGEAFRVGVEAAEALLSGALDRANTAPDRGPVPAQSRPAGERDAGAR